MITIMKTSTFMQSIEDAYEAGVNAGTMAQKLTDHDDQNRRLEDMLHRGKEIGKNEGFMEGYRKGYEVGYSEGELDAKCEVGEIDLPVADDMEKAVEEAEA